MIMLMAQAWDEIDADDGIRAVILTGGEGSSYCVGGDLADGWMVRGPSDKGSAPRPERTSAGSVITDGLLLTRSLAKPLIAAVNGACLGGGCEMLQQTDIRVAEEHAVFGLPEARWGGLIAGAGSTVRLKRQIPYTKAMEMILTGEPLTAAEAITSVWSVMSFPRVDRWRRHASSRRRCARTVHWQCGTRRHPSWPLAGSTRPMPVRSNSDSSWKSCAPRTPRKGSRRSQTSVRRDSRDDKGGLEWNTLDR